MIEQIMIRRQISKARQLAIETVNELGDPKSVLYL